MNGTMSRTMVFVGAAVVLGGLALATRPAPPEVAFFDDEGEMFYPGFTDPLAATSLEVIAYDQDSGTATPFKVQLTDGRWSIPSHYDYPADGEEQLAKTAASMIDLRKDKIRSDRLQDHEALGVIDPLEQSSASLQGRGTRVTLRDAANEVLCDYIIGNAVDGQEGFRYVRLPEKKRVYAAQLDVNLTTKFADWIETNLLDLEAADIRAIDVNDYSIDETSGTLDMRAALSFSRPDSTGSSWTLAQLPGDAALDASKVNGIATALAKIRITGVRPKPPAMSADLRTKSNVSLDIATQLSLQSRGFYFSQDGSLLSNEGEVIVGTLEGVRYTLRFGEVLYGEGQAVSAGLDDASDGADGEGDEVIDGDEDGPENRYLFVTAHFDESLLGAPPTPPAADVGPTPPLPSGDDTGETPEEGDDAAQDDAAAAAAVAQAAYEHELATWNEKVEAGRAITKQLNDRFAAWYYVISAADFQKIRVSVEDVLAPPPAG